MINPPPFNVALINAVTPYILAQGERVLQTHKFADNDADHVDRLLSWLDPALGSLVIDMGCGVGEVPKLMHQRRPDLRFLMVNISTVQLAECPVGDAFASLLADAHDTRLMGEIADAVMFNSALANMDAYAAMREASRLLRRGGTVLLNEMVSSEGTSERFESLLGARALRESEMRDAIALAGLEVVDYQTPKADDSSFRKRLGENADLLDSIIPSIWRLRKP